MHAHIAFNRIFIKNSLIRVFLAAIKLKILVSFSLYSDFGQFICTTCYQTSDVSQSIATLDFFSHTKSKSVKAIDIFFSSPRYCVASLTLMRSAWCIYARLLISLIFGGRYACSCYQVHYHQLFTTFTRIKNMMWLLEWFDFFPVFFIAVLVATKWTQFSFRFEFRTLSIQHCFSIRSFFRKCWHYSFTSFVFLFKGIQTITQSYLPHSLDRRNFSVFVLWIFLYFSNFLWAERVLHKNRTDFERIFFLSKIAVRWITQFTEIHIHSKKPKISENNPRILIMHARPDDRCWASEDEI